jgi:hypothetical protein
MDPGPAATRLRLRRDELLRSFPAAGRLELRLGPASWIRLRWGPRCVIGRAPDADLVLEGAGLSRHHAELRGAAGGGIIALDHATRSGTFWNTEALVPGEPEPLVPPGTLGLGATVSLEVTALGAGDLPHGVLLARLGDERHWTAYLPRGGPLGSPRLPIPLTLRPGLAGRARLVPAPGLAVSLNGRSMEPGEGIDPLAGDVIALGEGTPAVRLEVLA